MVKASPWIVLIVLCTSASFYYVMSTTQDKEDNSVNDIGVSLGALSLRWHDEHSNSNHNNTSWFSKLNELNLLNVNPPVTIDTSRQILSPPKLKLRGTFSWQTKQSNEKMNNKNYSIINKQYYIIIIISCLLLVSVTCNVVLIHWIT